MKRTDTSIVNIPLGSQAHQLAQRFAIEQASPHKSKQVYLNTLAVYAVHRYLKRLQIETDLSQSDSWNPGMRVLFDVADLVLPGVGKLECRPVLPSKTAFALPSEVAQERIGYVAVQFNEYLNQVQLLGFVPAVDTDNPPEQIEVKDLKSCDVLIDDITEREAATMRQTHAEKISSQPQNKLGGKFIKLLQWLEGHFAPEWQPVELLLANSGGYRIRLLTNITEPSLLKLEQPRKGIRLGKVISLKSEEIDQAVAFTVEVSKKSEEKFDICLSLYPYGNVNHLPSGFKLTVIDELEKPFLEESTKKTDNQKEIKFDADPEERFSVKLAFKDICITEQFIVSG